jgi:hypothetical protein
MMSYVPDCQDPCWRYLLGRRASGTMSGSLHMSFGCSWTDIEILVNEFFAQVGAPSEKATSCRLEEC